MILPGVDCTHLKSNVGRANCRSCINYTEIKLYGCTVYGKCTIGKEIEGISCCKTCPLNKLNQELDPMPNLKWQYGITTVPQRRNDLLIKTLTSLRDSGFTAPHIFVDGGYQGYEHIGPGLQTSGITYRMPKLGVVGNWLLSMAELYILNPRSDRYAIFQDDIILCHGVRDYLDTTSYPTHSYLNLFSFTLANEKLIEGKTGFIPSNQMGRGAVALVFNRDAVKALLNCSDKMIEKIEAARNHDRNIDGYISDRMKEAGYTEYIHAPSLVQHAGDKSTLGHHSEKAKTFNAEYNPMNLITK